MNTCCQDSSPSEEVGVILRYLAGVTTIDQAINDVFIYNVVFGVLYIESHPMISVITPIHRPIYVPAYA